MTVTTVAYRLMRRRANQARDVLRRGGVRQLGSRVLRQLADRLHVDDPGLPVRMADLCQADIEAPPRRHPMRARGDGRLRINWIMSPPGRGSGGHTTAFRLIQHLEDAGHECRVYLDTPYSSRGRDFAYMVHKEFPKFRGLVDGVEGGMADADAVFATGWETAYRAYVDDCSGKRFYLVQDFEPWFYAPGGLSALAESTYRMGFHAVTAGRFLAEKLRDDHGMSADYFDFGCDTTTYRHLDAVRRDGVVFYARKHSPRRAFELGAVALEIFRQRHPDVRVHLFGDRVKGLGPGWMEHGVVSPEQLNVIYNRCFAGLSLSMTNVSLVPLEMLSAGCIPVVNDAVHNRRVLTNEHVRWANPTPHALAAALSAVVDAADFPGDLPTCGGERRRNVVGRGWRHGREGSGARASAADGCQRGALGEVASATTTRATALPSAGTLCTAGRVWLRSTPA